MTFIQTEKVQILIYDMKNENNTKYFVEDEFVPAPIINSGYENLIVSESQLMG